MQTVVYANAEETDDWLRLGWQLTDLTGGLSVDHHGKYSVIIFWSDKWLCKPKLLKSYRSRTSAGQHAAP